MKTNFYRDNSRRIIIVFLLSLLLNLVEAGAILYIIMHPPLPKYFPTSINNRITPLFPLNRPNQAESSFLQWVNQAIMAAFTYNFVNYRQELKTISTYFTPAGWKQFNDFLINSGDLDKVKSRKLVVSAIATSAPIILQKGVLQDVFSWRVQMPIIVTYQNDKEVTQQNKVVTLLVVRVDTLHYLHGIAISQFIVVNSDGRI